MMKDTELRAHGVQFGLPSTTLWSCSYGVPVRLKFPEGELLRIQFRQRGVGATQTGKEMIVVDESQSCIFAGEAEVFFGDDYTQLAWRVALGDLQRKLTALTGWSSARPLSFDPALNLRTPQARSMLSVLDSLIGLS